MSAIREARQDGSTTAAASSSGQAGQRFSLLCLQEEEYLFRDHAAYLWEEGGKRCGLPPGWIRCLPHMVAAGQALLTSRVRCLVPNAGCKATCRLPASACTLCLET